MVEHPYYNDNPAVDFRNCHCLLNLSCLNNNSFSFNKYEQECIWSALFQISIKKTCAIHMTINKDGQATVPLPVELRALFRTVSLVKPDFGLILKAKCAAMGFRVPIVLGGRLKTLSELAKDQL